MMWGHLKRGDAKGDHIMKSYASILALAAAGLLAVGALTGCNTVRGAGQDIQEGGEAIENAAEEVQN